MGAGAAGERAPHRLVSAALAALTLGMAGFHLYTAVFGVLSPLLQRSIHLIGLTLICFLGRLAVSGRRTGAARIMDWLLPGLTLCVGFYILFSLSPGQILNRGIMGPTGMETIAGALLMVIILEGTRRTVGLPITLVAVAFLAYAFFGPYMPEAIAHKGYGFERLTAYLVWSTEGIFGIPIAVSATFIVIFILFGAFLDKLGAGEFFINLALAVTGRIKGGPALTSVIASGLMGSISGSSVSNVVTTGAFTIPLMKRVGYSPVFAGAVEAVASTGGQIMPPVMGAGAFVMAEFLGIPYAQVAMAAAVPAVLYFLSIGLMVYFEAEKKDIGVVARDAIPRLSHTLKQGLYLLLPLFALIYLLVVKQYSPLLAGFWGICALVATASCVTLIREKRVPWREIVSALDHGVRTAVPVAMACATAGIVIGVVSLTALGVRFTNMIIDLSQGTLWLAALLTMTACVILGMGLPTTAAYIVTAILGAPALANMGVSPLTAHMFIFYFAIISFITPPVAISAYAASGVSGANAMKTGFLAFKLGIAGFIVPYLFLYSPALLGGQGLLSVLLRAAPAILGIAALAASFIGWFVFRLSPVQRLALFAGSIALVTPYLLIEAVGAAILIALFVYGRARRKNAGLGPA